MTCLNKLFLNYMQISGFTCGLDDLLLKKKGERTKKEALEEVHKETVQEVCAIFGEKAPQDIYWMGRSEYKVDKQGKPV